MPPDMGKHSFMKINQSAEIKTTDVHCQLVNYKNWSSQELFRFLYSDGNKKIFD